MKIIDLVYFSNDECASPEEILAIHQPSLGFVDYFKKKADILLVKHGKFSCIIKLNGIIYAFFRRSNKFWQVPFKTHAYIRKQQPDVVIVNGLVFPLQTILLKLTLGAKVLVICQHHGEKPFSGVKVYLQRLANKYVDGYFFSALDNAVEWIENKVISREKCLEVPAGSTAIEKLDKMKSRAILKMDDKPVFLWVGRLAKDKDPLTVIGAFQKYSAVNPDSTLYLIFQGGDLLDDVRLFITNCQSKNIISIGFIPNNELAVWYSAADYFLSGSHRESLGYAMLESMACGCIPIVPDIPTFRKNTAGGKYGFLFEKGNMQSLMELLVSLNTDDIPRLSLNIIGHFRKTLSYEKVTEDFIAACNKLNDIDQ